MDVSEILDGLNDKQREAVAAPAQNLLVLAGAGSGKTRVLVHRIAWLMNVENISPLSILAVTFTNKAAREMKGRVEHLAGHALQSMWIGTFHGLAYRLLRAHPQEAGLPDNFQILDADDQYRLVRRILKTLNLDEKKWPPKQIQWFINGNKDEGLRAKHIPLNDDPSMQTMRDIYAAYEESCQRSGLVDFAELLLRAHELWLNNPSLLEHYQKRFRAILVDEFQDTNNIQYAWLRLLATPDNTTMIVGDDDQSIYGWRGAKIENIQRFLDDYSQANTIRLEQNYRSTSTILNAANAVIKRNSGRLGKDLWTDGEAGHKVALYTAFNEVDEARFIVERIKDWRLSTGNLKECAILYRSNAQSRVLEEGLLHAQLPYRIYGGLRFFERQEIKDALAYMRLINMPNDDAAFERVINTPSRGLGEKTVDAIRLHARQQNCALWQAANHLIIEDSLNGRAKRALSQFVELILKLTADCEQQELERQADMVIKHSGLYAMYQAEKGEKAQARVENLEELVTACKQFHSDENEDITPLAAFLAHASLEAGENQADQNEDAVQLMTIHSAKGLEFPFVTLAGVEEGMFPSQQSNDDPSRLEEERRLCYVGMTRAMKQLLITYAECRKLYGQDKFHSVSRFVREIPSEYVEEIRLRNQVHIPVYNRFDPATSHQAFEDSGFSLGQRVLHKKFGQGTVLNYEGAGEHGRVQVNFDDFGSKWLVLAYAKLEKI